MTLNCTLVQGVVPISLPSPGYDITPLLPLRSIHSGWAGLWGVNPSIKLGAGVPKIIRLGEIIPLWQLLRCCWCQSSIDTHRSLGFPIHIERVGLLPGQQLVFHTLCPGYVAPMERTLQRYSILSSRRRDTDDDEDVSYIDKCRMTSRLFV